MRLHSQNHSPPPMRRKLPGHERTARNTNSPEQALHLRKELRNSKHANALPARAYNGNAAENKESTRRTLPQRDDSILQQHRANNRRKKTNTKTQTHIGHSNIHILQSAGANVFLEIPQNVISHSRFLLNFCL